MRVLCLAFLLLPAPLAAQDLASADALRAAIIGNTVAGSMAASGDYAEYYAPDGTIHAADYDGRWSFDGNRMCFAYGDDPAACWAAVINGASVVWMGDGEEGSGRIRAGNPAGW